MNTTENHTPGPLTAKWLCEALLVYRDHGGVPTQELVAEILRRSAAPDLLEALHQLAEIGEGGVIERRETGKPTWSALDAVKTIARAAIAKAEKK